MSEKMEPQEEKVEERHRRPAWMRESTFVKEEKNDESVYDLGKPTKKRKTPPRPTSPVTRLAANRTVGLSTTSSTVAVGSNTDANLFTLSSATSSTTDVFAAFEETEARLKTILQEYEVRRQEKEKIEAGIRSFCEEVDQLRTLLADIRSHARVLGHHVLGLDKDTFERATADIDDALVRILAGARATLLHVSPTKFTLPNSSTALVKCPVPNSSAALGRDKFPLPSTAKLADLHKSTLPASSGSRALHISKKSLNGVPRRLLSVQEVYAGYGEAEAKIHLIGNGDLVVRKADYFGDSTLLAVKLPRGVRMRCSLSILSNEWEKTESFEWRWSTRIGSADRPPQSLVDGLIGAHVHARRRVLIFAKAFSLGCNKVPLVPQAYRVGFTGRERMIYDVCILEVWDE